MIPPRPNRRRRTPRRAQRNRPRVNLSRPAHPLHPSNKSSRKRVRQRLTPNAHEQTAASYRQPSRYPTTRHPENASREQRPGSPRRPRPVAPPSPRDPPGRHHQPGAPAHVTPAAGTRRMPCDPHPARSRGHRPKTFQQQIPPPGMTYLMILRQRHRVRMLGIRPTAVTARTQPPIDDPAQRPRLHHLDPLHPHRSSAPCCSASRASAVPSASRRS